MRTHVTTIATGPVQATAKAHLPSQSPLVALSTPGTFHTFDMARELEKAGMLAGIHTGYPRFKLRTVDLPINKVRTFPWLKGPYMAGWVPARLRREWEFWDRISFDTFVSVTMPDCDIFCGLSGSVLRSGQVAHNRGAYFVCDRGSSHIRFQDQILREEHDLWGIPFPGVDKRTIADEEAEYELADCILVPSNFAYRSFVEMGVAAKKLCLTPYGVDLSRFRAVARPASDTFDALFVGGLSVRKGAGYLFKAYESLQHPAKSLTIVGVVSQEIKPTLAQFVARNTGVRLLGHVPQGDLKAVMSRSHVLILPSIEEGFGLVQAQAMACGCPVIASQNTGAENLFRDAIEGYIVPVRNAAAIAEAMQRLADDPALREALSSACLARVSDLGGWNEYGNIVRQTFVDLACRGPLSSFSQMEVA